MLGEGELGLQVCWGRPARTAARPEPWDAELYSQAEMQSAALGAEVALGALAQCMEPRVSGLVFQSRP